MTNPKNTANNNSQFSKHNQQVDQTSPSNHFASSFSVTAETANNWLLPDGVHDVLFAEANKQEYLRHHLLKGLQLKGYDLVTPPLIEYTESLIGNASEFLKRQTFKIIDQLTGRLMGIRADITPQISRIDANYGSEGVCRYCYAGHTLHTLPSGLFGLRTPLQLGAEIFGTDSIQADFELLDIICELFLSLKLNTQIHLDLGHVGIFARLHELAQLSHEQTEKLIQLYQNKALPELAEYCQQLPLGDDFYAMAKYGHDTKVLKQQLSKNVVQDSAISDAIDELDKLYHYLLEQTAVSSQAMNVSIDVTELSGYRYHSGAMFNIYINGNSQPLLRGGRFDGGKQNNDSKPRPAIGFSMDITRLIPYVEIPTEPFIVVSYADLINAEKQTTEIKQTLLDGVEQLRNSGYRVVIPLSAEDKPKGAQYVMRLQALDAAGNAIESSPQSTLDSNADSSDTNSQTKKKKQRSKGKNKKTQKNKTSNKTNNKTSNSTNTNNSQNANITYQWIVEDVHKADA